MAIVTGVAPLDLRTTDVEPGGLYLLAGPPDSAKLAALLQFLSTGLEEGSRCGLVTGSHPGSVLAQAKGWGLSLEAATRERRLLLLAFEGDFARRLLHSGEPESVFEELADLLGPDLGRIAIDPGAPLWETRADGMMGNRFVEWAEATGATVWATIGGSLDDRVTPSTEWVMQGARGILEFERSSDGRRQIWIRKFEAPLAAEGPISVELSPGAGLVAPRAEPQRRRTDVGEGAEHRLLLLSLVPEVPADIEAWARSRFQVISADDPLLAVQALGEEPAVGACLVYLDRSTTSRAVEVCRTLRPLTPAPLVLIADEPLRTDDRTLVLDAGADEVVSGGVHLPELERRLERIQRRCLASRTRPPEGAPSGAATEGILEPEVFREEVTARLGRERPDVFSLLDIRTDRPTGPLLEAVRSQIRWDTGDFASRLAEDRVGVVLRGARRTQGRAFLERLRRSLPAEEAESLQVEILASPAHLDAIRSRVAS